MSGTAWIVVVALVVLWFAWEPAPKPVQTYAIGMDIPGVGRIDGSASW